MKKTEIIMGMPITIEIVDETSFKLFDKIFNYFRTIDNRFSTYKPDSEISKINDGLDQSRWSKEMKIIFNLSNETKEITKGYFNIFHNGMFDPSGLVKGWAVNNAVNLLKTHKVKSFYIEAGGDIEVSGTNEDNEPWTVGIRNPFKTNEIIKSVILKDQGMATSGNYIRGQHIYNPHNDRQEINDIKSLSVIAANVYEADRFATAAFAMGKEGISFIESMPGLEGYMVDSDQIATFTSGFEKYVVNNA
jgi:thiamine biosynthesis lipoprotein